jgi:hypothetical protein
VQTYGAKQHVIKNRQFMHAIQHLGSVLSVTDNLDRVVKKATSGLGEASVLKIYLSTPRTASDFQTSLAIQRYRFKHLIGLYHRNFTKNIRYFIRVYTSDGENEKGLPQNGAFQKIFFKSSITES